MAAIVILPGMCEKCGGSMVNKGKSQECEDCGHNKAKQGK